MATLGIEPNIEKVLAPKIKMLLDDIQVLQDKVVRIAKQIQVHNVEPNTAALLTRVISGHSTSIDQLKSDLEQKLQSFGVEVAGSVEGLTQSKNAIDIQRGELTKKEDALMHEKTSIDALIKDYEQRIGSIAVIQKNMDSLVDKLNTAQNAAVKHELLVKDLQKTMDQTNNGHYHTIQKLEQEYKATVTKIGQEKDKVDKELENVQKKLDDKRTQFEIYKADQIGASTRQSVRIENMEQELKQLKEKMEQDAIANADHKARSDQLEAENEDLRNTIDDYQNQLLALQSQPQDKRHGSGMTERTAATGRKVGAIIQRGMESVRQRATRGRPTTPGGVPTTSPGNFSSNMSSNVASKVPSKTPSMFGPELGSTIPSTAASNLEGMFRPAASVIGLPDPDRGGIRSSFGGSTSTVRLSRPPIVPDSASTTSLGKHSRVPGETPDVTKKTKTVDRTGVPGQTTLTIPRARPHSAAHAVNDPVLDPAPQDQADRLNPSVRPDEFMTMKDFLETEAPREQIESQARLEPDDMQFLTGGDDQEIGSPHDNEREPSQYGPQVDQELTSNQDAEAERARRDGAAPAIQLPNQTVWADPFTTGGNHSRLYNAIRKPANWDEEANNSLISTITGGRSFATRLDEFHLHPLCMQRRLARIDYNTVPAAGPCGNCIEEGLTCWGLKTLPDTTPAPTSRRGRPRMDFGVNSDGHYWEAIYRPVRGPGDNDGDGPSGSAPTV